ncbi:MAG: hypothetical protein R2778_09730 [Saprospiraceae bacterium]
MTGTDIGGNTARSCSFSVELQDNTNPTTIVKITLFNWMQQVTDPS